MKAQILEQLRNADGILSGEALSQLLGTSRVAVWKHIRSLQDCGYEIETGSRGYRLVQSPDTPYPWEMGTRETLIHYHDQATSTMDLARDLARQGCPHMTVVVAGRQSKGRGRLQRQWHSAKGGLYFTLVLRPKIEPLYAGRLGFYTAVIWAETLRTLYNVPAEVKWPNDILVAGRKLIGLLAEMEADSDQVISITIGCGINLNNKPQDKAPNATALTRILGQPVSRRKLLSAFLDHFEADYPIAATEAVIARWKALTMTLGRRVQVVTIREKIQGIAVDVDPSGALLVQLDDGSIRPVLYGDCFVQEE